MNDGLSRFDSGRFAGVDALRGVAALMVCLFHWEHMALGTSNQQQVFRLGLLGVELFFLISGFVILMVAERSQPIGQFVGARVVRLYPVYLASVLLTALYVLQSGKYGAATVLVNFSMLQSFVSVPNITNPYWTLAFEIGFYAALTLVLRFRLMPRLEELCLIWLAISLAYRIIAPGAMNFDEARPIVQLAFILFAPQFAPFFILGMLVYRWRTGRLGRQGKLAGVMALALTLFGRGDFAQIDGAIYSAATLIMVIALNMAARLRASGVIKPLAFVGVISYPLYLVHCTIANLVTFWGGMMGLPALPAVLASVPIAFAVAAFLHSTLEKPSRAAWRRFLQRRSAWRSPAAISANAASSVQTAVL